MVTKLKPLKNGRSICGDGFSRVSTEMQNSAAFRSLSKSALRVLIWGIWKQYNAATNRGKGDSGNPRFRLTNAEAKTKLGMGSSTFSNAKAELIEKGFWTCPRRGGLKGCNGVASEFELSSDWRQWQQPISKKRAPPLRKKAAAVNGLGSE